MAISFRHLPKGSTIGSGSYVFRHYGDEIIPYLCFTAEEAGSTIGMSVTGTPTKGQAFETSTDEITWSAFIPGTTTITLSNVGSKVYFRGNNTTVSESSSIYYTFSMTGTIAASGNIMSLLDKTCKSTTISNAYCFYCLFAYCSSLTTAPALPATTLVAHCYDSMFADCVNITTASALPATTLSPYCYNSMFLDCYSLTTVPALPATTLASHCYDSMFIYCNSLQVYSSSGTGHTNAWRIPTSGTASSYTTQSNMFMGCTGSYEYSDSVSLNATFYTQNTPVS